MARTKKQMQGRVEVCRATVRSDLTFMERRLTYLGCADVSVERGVVYRPGQAQPAGRDDSRRLLRAFVLTVPATEYARAFPPLERGTPKRNSDTETEEGE